MARITIKPDGIAKAIQRELTLYGEDVQEKLREITRESLTDLVRKTRATAPKDSGDFAKHISGDFKGLARGLKSIKGLWYVKAPHYRLTHLLVHGHEKRNGGRVNGDPFLKNALDQVLPEYEKKVEEAIKNGK